MLSIEEQIKKALEEGKFENLPGKGKPLRMDDNPLEDPEWRMAYHMLRSSGYTLPWLETRSEIDSTLDAARTALSRAWAWRQEALTDGKLTPADIADEWERAVSAFREQIAGLNKRIFSYNLEVPSERFQMLIINVDREIARLTAAALSDTL